MALHVFVDEVANFRGGRDRYCIFTAFTTHQPRVTRKCFIRAKQTKLPRKYRHYTEIKFSDRVISAQFKKHVLRQLSQEEIRIYSLVFARDNLPGVLQQQADRLIYCDLIGRLLELCPLAESQEVYLFLDSRNLKGLTRREFDMDLRKRLLPQLRKGARLEIQHIDSTTNVNIQVADFLCGAVFQKYERGNLEYYTLIADRISAEEKLFEE